MEDAKTWHDAITARNDLESPLLRLPGELRNRIYEYALNIGTFHFTARSESSRKPRPNFFGLRTPKPHAFALLCVCRRIYPEISSFQIPFAVNTHAFSLFYRLSAYYVHLTPEQLSWITSVDVEDRGVESLHDVMPGVRRVHIRFNRVADVQSGMTEEEEEQMKEDEETITNWLRGSSVGKVEVTVSDEPSE
ncbi:hypothetical protein HBI56_095650 [Parastagonospora nodorum]|nr:hypothetical protein HBH53_142710 [Parastagonospora nodorum]KAH3966647.1 hypothetical protein HBH51_142630 [Parastagonospora nodorum]KAH3989569.1 hypothetical protein HBH52_017650 [Parastagonospora nodorum]KAH3998169.1 hypothetical protein HBI10_130540 [Parastagonospora nodorum]KAH4030113.1 hypothetical protein HBI13_037040 [Parastagonospora nodorum]